VNTTNLSEGQHYATITVSSNNANNSPQTVQVTYTINPQPYIQVTDPHNGDRWSENSTYAIRWNHEGGGLYVRIELFIGNDYLCTITSSTPNSDQFDWIVNDCSGGPVLNYRIKVTDTSYGYNTDFGDYFNLIPWGPVSLEVTWGTSGIFVNGNYPPAFKTNLIWTPLNDVHYDDPNWSSCTTPNFTVHCRLNPMWPLLDASGTLSDATYYGIYIDPSASSVTINVTADFQTAGNRLDVSFENCTHEWTGYDACHTYSIAFARGACGSGSYYPVKLEAIRAITADEVAVSKMLINFNGWYGAYDY
jgi:hypothetical protein